MDELSRSHRPGLRTRRGWPGRLLAAALVAGLALLLSAAPSRAHSQEVASDPADRSTVSSVPPAVTLTFNQNVIGLGTRVQVTGPDGDVTDGATTVTNNIVRQVISPSAPAGTFTVDWRVTSADGHPVSGTFSFTAKQAAGGAPGSPSPAPGNEAVTAAPTTVASVSASPASSDGGDGGGLGGLSAIGLGVIVLAVVIAFGAALSAVLRSRRT